MALSLRFCVYVCVGGGLPFLPCLGGFCCGPVITGHFISTYECSVETSDPAQCSRTRTPPLGTLLLICSQELGPVDV